MVNELVSRNDPLLEPLLRAADEAAREREIERLIVETAQPLTRRILGRYAHVEGTIRSHDADDVVATVNLCIVRKLRAVARSAEEAVPQFENYVATLAYNAVNDHLRRRYPERMRLKNRLRYLLAHDPRLASWSTPGGRAAGLAEWEGSDDVTAAVIDRGGATARMLDRDRPADAVVEILRRAGQPMLLHALADTVARLWDVADASLVGIEHASEASEEIGTRLEARSFLRALWREVRLLPPAQRKALLLNLRDRAAVNAVALFALTGVVSAEEIAAALEMSVEALSAIWNELPLDDLRIADLLTITRQQVINLRKSARERLARRLFGRKRDR